MYPVRTQTAGAAWQGKPCWYAVTVPVTNDTHNAVPVQQGTERPVMGSVILKQRRFAHL